MKWMPYIVLSLMLAAPRMVAGEEDLTAQVQREYEELKALEAEAERLRQLQRFRAREINQLKKKLASTGDPIDGHELLERVMHERVKGMASNPPITCEFRVWMNEIGSVDLVQRVSCDGAVMGVIFGAIGEHHNRLTNFRYQSFSHPREEFYQIIINDKNKTSITRRYAAE